MAKGEVILKNKAVKDASIVKYDDAVTQRASGVEEGRPGIFTSQGVLSSIVFNINNLLLLYL